jgi:hypothetical protein
MGGFSFALIGAAAVGVLVIIGIIRTLLRKRDPWA